MFVGLCLTSGQTQASCFPMLPVFMLSWVNCLTISAPYLIHTRDWYIVSHLTLGKSINKDSSGWMVDLVKQKTSVMGGVTQITPMTFSSSTLSKITDRFSHKSLLHQILRTGKWLLFYVCWWLPACRTKPSSWESISDRTGAHLPQKLKCACNTIMPEH